MFHAHLDGKAVNLDSLSSGIIVKLERDYLVAKVQKPNFP